MNKFLLISIMLAFPFGAFSQSNALPNSFNVIPKPLDLKPIEGKFVITEKTKVYYEKGSNELKGIAQNFVNQINVASGLSLAVQEIPKKPMARNSIAFALKKVIDKSLGDDSYYINISKTAVIINSSKPKGAFYAVQTLLQLLPSSVFNSTPTANIAWEMPACIINDNPRYAYRGLMLDMGRHFYSVQTVKKFIDLLALHKMNQFHWHLTEDQGWRIEIKKYPKLTEIGSKRKETMAGYYTEKRFDGTPYGGFYTQDEIKEVVAYAQTKYINVIPEIEMPGHAMAALAAYPELGCTGGPYEVSTKWGVFEDVYCPTEKTFEFIENVLTEVISLFPSTYVHIGGDECPKTSWEKSPFCQDLMKKEGLKNEHELQSYFIKRIDKFLTSKGKKMIGWDEILEGGLSPNATVMSWRGIEGGITAAKQQHDVIMTPTSHVYFDYYQGEPASEPLAIGGYLPLDKVYSYEPTPSELSPSEAKHILGVQGNIWTEYIATPEHLEYMAFPRASAIAEIAWSSATKNYEDFSKRLKVHQERLKFLNVNFCPKALYNISAIATSNATTPLNVKLNFPGEDLSKNEVIRFTTDRSTPTAQSPIYQKPFEITKDHFAIRAATFSKNGQQLGNVLSKDYEVSKSTGKKYTLLNKNNDGYNGGSEYGLTNGILGEEKKMETWVGFNGVDLDAVVDLGEVKEVNRVTVQFLRANDSWIFPPKTAELFVSMDGVTFVSIQQVELDTSMQPGTAVQHVGIGAAGVKARFVKIIAKNYGKLPEGHPGKGNPAWLFVDEIVVD